MASSGKFGTDNSVGGSGGSSNNNGPRSSKRGEPHEPTRSEQGSSWRRGGSGEGRGEGGFRSSERNSSNNERGSWRGGDRSKGDDRGRSWRGGDRAGTDCAPSSGERPRFQLRQKGARENDDVTAQMEKLDVQNNVETTADKANDRNEAPAGRSRREPEVVNSRAAGLSGGDSSSSFRRENRERGSAPGRGGGSDSFRRDERGPPPTANSRFAAAAEADRSNRDERGPPPTANSRFAAAAEADRSKREDRGPPPVANSRFAAVAEADRSSRDELRRDERGPPPMTNSRFAAAAALAEQENMEREQRRAEYTEERKAGGNRFDRGGPPLPQSSRFASAVMADSDYVDREERDRRYAERQNERHEGGPREDRRFGGPREDRGYGGPRHNPAFEPEKDYFELRKEQNNKVAELLKPKARPVEDNILKIPDKPALHHEENMLKMPTKEVKKETAPAPAPKAKEPEASVPAPPTKHSEGSLQEFIRGDKQGGELKAWCESQGAALPPVKRLVFSLLSEKEKLNPDINCSWAEPSKFGAAFLSMVEDDLYGQMQILWGIQQYCDSLGFPKLNEEYVVQAMFRAMYKYDLASDDAFQAWKEDESTEHEKGKVTAIIQTVDWFNWLEEDEDEDGEEDEEEYEEEE